MKEILEANSNITVNSKQIEVLKKNFPQCFDKDGNFIIHKMQEIVGENGLDLSKESYSLNWLGKSYARLLANENPLTLLKEDKQHNKKPNNINSENLLIKGDNLEVLKHLSSAYSEQIKMIYIDPPYNTGSDGFVYNDDRKFSVSQLCQLAGIDRDEAKRILDFTASKANSHSAWLTFMYPRLYIARELLKDEGVIFISIDDNEVAQLKMLCDEVFGEENFVGLIPTIMNLNGNSDNFGFVDTHEYFLVYSKDKNYCEINQFDVDEDELLKDWKEDDYGLYKKSDGLKRTGDDASRVSRPKGWFPVFITEDNVIYVTADDRPKGKTDIVLYPLSGDNEELSWSWSKDKIKKDNHNLFVTNGRKGKSIYKKKRQDIGDIPTKKPKSYFYKAEYSTSTATTILKKLMNAKIFKGSKPVPFISDLVKIGTNDDEIVLDFFAGSGTTSHAVMQLNAEDGGNRQIITVQIPEKTDIKSTAYDEGYKTVFDITKARIEKAAIKIAQDYPDYKGDLGFKIFEVTPVFDGYLDDINEFDPQIELFDGKKLTDEELDILLCTWKVYDGLRLTDNLQTVELDEYKAYYSDSTLYLMDKGFGIDCIKALITKLDDDKSFAPAKIVVFGYNFNSVEQKQLVEGLNNYSNKKSIELDVLVRY